MGTAPDNDDYDSGDDCAICLDVLFDGVTPKYVEADVFGVVKCPMAFGDPPAGTFLLTQTAPCSWMYLFDGKYSLSWDLRPHDSTFIITFPGFFWFLSIVLEPCFDAFVNQNVCGVGPTFGENGYVTLWWGPTIGP